MPLKDLPAINPYEVLGIQKEASEDDIRKAFYNKMREYHPDKNRDNLEFATYQTKLINHAKELLTDPEKRQAIDATLVMPPLAASTEENAAKRHSWMIDDQMQSYSNRFQKEALPLLDHAKIQALLDKCNPEKNHHFNQRYFQGLYALKIGQRNNFSVNSNNNNNNTQDRYVIELTSDSEPSTGNPALELFKGDGSASSCFSFSTWYHPEICHYLLHMVNDQAQCLRVIFNDAGGNNTETFKSQLQTLIVLANRLNKPALFIGKEPGAENHFVCGLIKANNLLLINPLGTTKHSAAYETLKELQQDQTLANIWLSSTTLQRREYEQDGLVSCGPLSLELALHILKSFTLDQINQFWDSLLKTDEVIVHDASQLHYFAIHITPLLPTELHALTKIAERTDYVSQIMAIRQRHGKALETFAAYRAKADNMTVETYLKKCKEAAPAQVVYNALHMKDYTLLTIERLPEYAQLAEALNKPESNIILERCGQQNSVVSNTQPSAMTQFIAPLNKEEKTNTVAEKEVSFTDLYAYLAQKQQLFTDSTEKPLLPRLKTTEVILNLVVDFLKGKLFGNTLTQVITYLRTDPASLLANAVAELFLITDLTRSYRQALSTIEVIYQTIEDEYRAYEQQCRSLQKEKTLQEKELAQAQCALQDAQLRCEEYEKLKPTVGQKQLLLTQKSALEKQLIVEKKEISKIKARDENAVSYKEVEILQITLDSIKQQIIHLEEKTLEIQARIDEEKIPQRNATIVQFTKRITQLEREITATKDKRFNATFLSLLENKYFKMLIAKCMQFYWQDSTAFDIAKYFQESTRSLPQFGKDEYGKYRAFHLILMLADKQLQRISAPNCSVAEVYEVAKIFVDLSGCKGTMGLIRPQALFKAGLCFQLASQKFVSAHEKMAAEHLALTYYQSALRVASHASSFHLLAILPTMVKAISQMQYQHKGMMSRKDLITHLNESFGKDNLSPWELNRLKIYNGDLLQTLECVLDRAQYELSIHPLNVVSNHLVKEVSRSFFCKELIDIIAINQAKILENPEARKAFENNHSMPDQLYQYYEAQIAIYDDNNHTLEQEEKMLLLRLQVMVALLERNNTSLKETHQWMNTPYIPMSQDGEGWFTAGPLNYPSDPKIAGTVYKGFLGYRINHLTGEVSFILDEWKPSDPEHLKLFTYDEFVEIIKNGINRAIFSLDQSEPYKRYAPIQTVRFSPANLENTTYARTLFLTDYLMKMMSTGREISGMAPYQTRSAENALKTLSPEIRNELLVCANKQNSEEDSAATRFWIELGQIPFEEQQIKATEYTLFQQPTVTIKKHLLDLSDDGSLSDAENDSSDNSSEAEFARAFTKHYLEIAVQFPVFLQLVEFHKIAGAVARMQAMREEGEKTIKQLQAELDNSEHWSTLRQKTKTEWQQKVNDPAYWNRLLEVTIAKYTKIVNDDNHWNLKIERLLEKLNQAKMALEAKSGEDYQRLHKQYMAVNIEILQKYQQRLHAFKWKVDSTECKKSYDNKLKEVSDSIKADHPEMPSEAIISLAQTLIGTPATYLAKLQQSLRQRLESDFAHNKSIIGKPAYAHALDEFKQGKVETLANMQARFMVKQFFSESASKEPAQVTFWQKNTNELLQRNKAELTAQVVASKPMLELTSGLKLTFSKLIYTVSDAEFLAFYNEIRREIYDDYVRQAKGQIPAANWRQHEASYLADINNKVDQDFSKQSQLSSFIALAKRAFEIKKEEWLEKLMSNNPMIIQELDKSLDTALQALVEGNVDLIAQAQTNIALNKAKAELAMGEPQNVGLAKDIWQQYVTAEIKKQTTELELGQRNSFSVNSNSGQNPKLSTPTLRTTTNSPTLQQLLLQGSCSFKANAPLQHIEFKELSVAKAFTAELLLRKGFGNRHRPDQPKEIEPVSVNSNNNNDTERYVVELIKAEWDALQPNEQEAIYRNNEAKSELATVTQSKTSSFDHLKEMFAEQAFKQLIEQFIQGNIQPLLEAETEHDIAKAIENLSNDQRPILTEKMTQERENLRQNLQQRAKSQVDAQKQAWQTNFENALDEYIIELQEEHRENIQRLGRLLQGFERIQLGRSSGQDEPANTHYRVPAVISKTNNRTVYGGVWALPSFYPAMQKRTELFNKLEQVDRSLSLGSSLNPLSMFSAATDSTFLNHNISFISTRLEEARREISEVSRKASSRDFSLQQKIWETERKIRDVENKLQFSPFQHAIQTSLAPWQRPIFQTYTDPLRYATSHFDGGLGTSSGSSSSNAIPPTGPSNNGLSAMGLWRTAEQKQKEQHHLEQVTELSQVHEISRSALSGVGKGLNGLWETVKHPLDNMVYPISELVYDAVIIGAFNTNSTTMDKDLRIINDQIMQEPRIYNDAVQRMKMRGEGIAQSLSAFKDASGSERVEKLAELGTTLFAPGYMFKAAGKLGKTLPSAGKISSSRLESLPKSATNFDYGVTFFSEKSLRHFVPEFGATTEEAMKLGATDKPFFFMPKQDAAKINSRVSAATETGHARSVLNAWETGRDIYRVEFPLNNDIKNRIRIPSVEDAGGYTHFKPGGYTAINDGTDKYLVNRTREFVFDGGTPMPDGTTVYRLCPDSGKWVYYWHKGPGNPPKGPIP